MRQEKPEKKMDAVHPGATNESTTFALLDLFSEPCFLMDNEGIILKSNKAFAERFSMLSDECTGRNVYDLLSSTILIHEAVESWRNKAKDVISTGKQESFEDEHDDRNLRHTIYPLCSPDGDIQNLLVIAQDITDLKRSEQVGEFEQAFRKAVIDVIPGTFYLLDSDVRLAAWNSYLRDEIIGKPECEMTGARVLEIIHPEDRSIIQEKMLNVLNLGLEERVEVRIFRKGGPEISWRLMTGKRIILNGKPFLIGMGIDITERKKAENELQKLNRALLAISECNQVLLHADKEEELLREICRIVVEIGGYRMAWVGYAENDDGKNVRPAAQAGFEEGYLETLMISWADIERGRGPTGTAIRTGQPCAIHDVLMDPQFIPWRMEATVRGYASVLSLPLKTGDKVLGALTMYSTVPDAFNTEETKLLKALADNLAYGIMMLQTRHARDVAEDALRQSEARYRSLFHNQHTVMLIIDPQNGMIVDANPAAVSFYGWDLRELCRKKISQLNLLEEQRIISEMEGESRQEGNCFISRHYRADGSTRDVEVFSAPITIQGKPLLYSVVHDVTERIRHESLTAFRQRLLQMAESCPVEELLRFTLDEAEKQTESRIGFYHFFEENTVMPALQVTSTNLHQKMKWEQGNISHPSILGIEFLADVLKNRHAVITNKYQKEEHKQIFSVSHPEISRTLVVPILQGEKVAGIFLVGNKPDAYVDDDIHIIRTISDIAWDIVSRKLAEQSQQEMQSALIQFQKMELVGQLAGGIAHDFNNMLDVIIGNIEMVMDQEVVRREPLQYKLKNILNAANRSSNLTRQLLAFAQKQTVMPLVLELNAMVENMLAVLRRLIGEHITIVWIPDTHRAMVKVDPSQIDQILVNLCVNARDAIAGVGKITIEIGRFCEKKTLVSPQHPCKINGDYVTLSVTDTGGGIEKEYFPHIFEPFFTTKGQGKSPGLGLSTVYGIVKQNNGCIDYTTEPGKGSTFKIHLPRYKGGYADPDESEQIPIESKRGKETILLVENEHDILILCKAALEDIGYTVLPAATSLDAMRVAGQHNGEIDLLVTDVVMPGMNGCDLARQLHVVTPGLKILFMSGYSNDVIPHLEMMTDRVNFIQKPFSLKLLIRMVHNILNHRVS